MKNNKFGIPVIIILLLVAIPAAVYGIYYNNVLINEAGNPEHLPYKDGKLYFYNAANQLIGYYECESTECAEASPSLEDGEMPHRTFLGTKVGVFNTDNIFIEDNGIKFVKLGKNGSQTLQNIKMFKYYDGELAPYVIYIDENDTYNLLNTEDGITIIAGAEKIIASSQMYKDIFGAGYDGQYGLYTIRNELMNVSSSLEIVDFTVNCLVYKDIYNNMLKIYDFDGKNELLSNVKDYLLTENYVVIKDDNGAKVYSSDLTKTYSEQSGADITFKLEEERLVFYSGTSVVGTYKYGEATEPEIYEPTPENDENNPSDSGDNTGTGEETPEVPSED